MNNCPRQNPAYRPTPTNIRMMTANKKGIVNPVSDIASMPLRLPSYVMRLQRMGCFHQTRLSFMRSLLRFLKKEQWRFERTLWEVDERGVGVVVYAAYSPNNTYSLICYANDLPPEKRSDRVIATEWDATFTLFDGVPDAQDIERLRANVPQQEAGHCAQSELVLARANRSVRLFEYVADCLAQGQQPQQEKLDSVGYLMRTTAVYGNGKYGISDRERICHRPEFKSAFRAELLAVWLIRGFTVDIVEHIARMRGGNKAVKINPELRRRLGVGNATGLGMAPFLVLHPALFHSWMLARETALARVRSIRRSTAKTANVFGDLVSRMMIGVASWNTLNLRQQNRINELKQDLIKLMRYVSPELEPDTKPNLLRSDFPWDALIKWSEQALSIEGQELVVSLVLEPHGALIDDLADTMAIDEGQFFNIDGGQKISAAIRYIENTYGWALALDYADKSQCARFWYVSEEKLEPRVGERFDEPGAEKEHPLSYARDVTALYTALRKYVDDGDAGSDENIASFLLSHPHHRHSVRRIQIAEKLPYAEIQDNLIAAQMVPVDLLRCKLSFFGANKFDPKSDRWVRINMYQYAPFPDEFENMDADDWIYPFLPTL